MLVIPSRKRAIEYAAASRLKRGISGILDRPVKPDDDRHGLDAALRDYLAKPHAPLRN